MNLARRRIAKDPNGIPNPPRLSDFARSGRLRSLLGQEDREGLEDGRKARFRLRGREKHSCDKGPSIQREKAAREQLLQRARGSSREFLFLAPPCARHRQEPRSFRKWRCPDTRPRGRPKVGCEFPRVFSAGPSAQLPISLLPSQANQHRLAIAFQQSSPRRFPIACGCPNHFRAGLRTRAAIQGRYDAAPCVMLLSYGW